jgi:hypothetical protein
MDLRGDRRGQSIQIGAIILFGVLIITFATYQAFVVPNQNQQVEFNHNQRVQGDMVEVRNSILTTKTTGEDGYAAVELGTEFTPRLIALNPPSPSGSLYTTDLRPIVVTDRGTGNDITTDVCPGDDIQTRFIEYSPNYAEFRNPGTFRYENSLLYKDFGTNDTVRLSSQQFVQGDTVQIIPIRRSFNRGGSGTIAVEPKAGLVDTSQREDINVTIPTQLLESQWETVLSGEVAPENITVTEGPGGRNLTVVLSGNFQVDCGAVGLGESPPSGERSGDGGGGDGDSTGINPAAPGDIRLQDESDEGNSEVALTFNNTGDSNNITEARISFYNAKNQEPTRANLSEGQGASEPSTTLQIRDALEPLNQDIELTGRSTTDVTLDFSNPDKPNLNLNGEDWFVFEIKLETGERATYFVPIPQN